MDATSYEVAVERDRDLNRSIVAVDIGDGFERYLEVLDRFYHQDVSVRVGDHVLTNRDSVRELLTRFSVVLHVMAEIGGVHISASAEEVRGDSPEYRHTEWQLECVGATGKTVTTRWKSARRWIQHRVIGEHLYDIVQIGEPLSYQDLVPLDL